MLIGAHVSTAGGLARAVERGAERGCEAIQVFPQSPRAWRPTAYSTADYAEFRGRLQASSLRSVVIHAIYLINCASREPEVRKRSLTALCHALRVGDEIGADGVVLHAGARKGEPHSESVERAGSLIREALAATERCPLLLENTAGTNGPLGRDPEELEQLFEAAGAHERLGVCLDSCHLFAAGCDAGAAEPLAAVLTDLEQRLGPGRLGCVHVNDSRVELGANLDRHAPFGRGELGERGLARFLSEPRFEGLPALLEGPGADGGGVEAGDIALAGRLRTRGRAARRRRANDPR